MTQIFNLGIRGSILKIVKEDHEKGIGNGLSKEDAEYLEYLESLPKGQWIDLDNNGRMISKEQADKNMAEHLSRFKPIKSTPTEGN